MEESVDIKIIKNKPPTMVNNKVVTSAPGKAFNTLAMISASVSVNCPMISDTDMELDEPNSCVDINPAIKPYKKINTD